MLAGRQESAWDHTATVLALLAEIHRDPDRRAEPFGPRDFHPWAQPAPELTLEERDAQLRAARAEWDSRRRA